mmetsp:Transcript_61563/g.133737  ORF Transcript_61563/g.133737 Transcript_61563/m.133737 type:complete len:129 (+) Transcript_61563:2-388(+)
MAQVKENISSDEFTLVDARPAGRFRGDEPEPRPIPSGHIPNSLNLPFSQLINPDGTFKSTEDLAAVLTATGVDVGKPTVVGCGSGVAACVVGMAVELVGGEPPALYDGSWTEWATNNQPIATSSSENN